MNVEDLRELANRAEGVRGRADDRLAEVHARIGAARRRRATEALAGTSAAVLALVVGVTFLTGPNGHQKGEPPPPADSNGPVKVVRKIVYTDDVSSIPHKARTPLGRVGTIHVGDSEVRIDQVTRTVSSWALRVTDGGAVYAKDDHSVWLTDGGEPRRIAEQACVDTLGSRSLAAANNGPWAVWFDCSPASQGRDLVVYDTVTGREVARHTISRCRGRDAAWPAYKCELQTVIGDHVYFEVVVDENTDVRRDLVLDVASGAVVAAAPGALAQDIDSHPRGLVVGDDQQTGVRTSGVQQVFRVIGSRLVPVEQSDLSSFVPSTAFDTGTGERLRLRLPGGYDGVRADPTDDPPFFVMFEWLDDGTVALVGGNTPNHFGDILVCHLADGRCEVAVKAPRGDVTRIAAHTWPPG
jgi:hypothetical protein